MVFSFPYHDPSGVYNVIFRKNMPVLKKLFDNIIVSVTPSTFEQNKDFVDYLPSEGIVIYINQEGSNIGDHFRKALSSSIEVTRDKELIFFSFIDRVLYILESGYKNIFISDIKTVQSDKLNVFERSEKAWNTHPKNYRDMEQFINNLLKTLSGKNIEMNFCAISLNRKIAEEILTESKTDDWAITGEWMLLSLLQSLPLTMKKVDWLSWEDPYWENIDGIILKKERESDKDETIKRIKSNIPFLCLLTEDRFREIDKI